LAEGDKDTDNNLIGYEVLTEVVMKNCIFWDRNDARNRHEEGISAS
jgi:hypothetical protein